MMAYATIIDKLPEEALKLPLALANQLGFAIALSAFADTWASSTTSINVIFFDGPFHLSHF
jgi:hypothetical protein